MKNTTGLFASIFVICMTISSCSRNPFTSIEDSQARMIIEQSIQAYGGLDNWTDISYLSFDKWYALYNEKGQTEINVTQEHHYTPVKKYMTWPGDGGKVEQIHYKNEYSRMLNGKPDPNAKAESVKNSMLAALFVMDLPYNLLDKTATISYEGQQKFNGQLAHVIRAEYHPERENKHTTKDIWWHYFDPESYLSTGYQVKHLDHISQVINESFHTVNGFTLPHKRKSYRVNENGEHLFLRAEYEYSEYNVLK